MELLLKVAIKILFMCALFIKDICINGATLNCPRGYDYNDNGTTCYFFSHDLETWVGAMMSCSILEGHLVEIESASEFEFLRNVELKIGSNSDMSRWIGLSNKRSVNEWEWATSYRVLSNTSSLWASMWAPGEPDQFTGHGGESCAAMDHAIGHTYHVADVECSRPMRYVCEVTPYQFPILG